MRVPAPRELTPHPHRFAHKNEPVTTIFPGERTPRGTVISTRRETLNRANLRCYGTSQHGQLASAAS
jgi:hypothetical protein